MALNYRHHFHAGNFADLLKHAVLLDVLARLTADPAPLTVIDSHAGAGRYDLAGDEARRSGEAEWGVAKLMGSPAPNVFDPLKAVVEAENRGGRLGHYPGSPLVAISGLRVGDRYVGFELRADDHASLQALLKARTPWGVGAEARLADGYDVLAAGEAGGGRRLVLIDPPFERGDEYQRVIEAAATDSERGGEATYLIWTPVKDLQTFDSFLGALEAAGLGPGVAIETRLRPLDNPLRLNGCAVILIGGVPLVEQASARALEAAAWIAERLGEAGGGAWAERLR